MRERRKIADAVAEARPLDWNSIPGNQREKLDRAKTSIRKELEREHRTRLLAEMDQYKAECDANVTAYKAQLDAQNQKLNAMRDEERKRYQLGIEVQRAKGLITLSEYTAILVCLHPDKRKHEDPVKFNRAFDLFNNPRIKTLLVKEK